MTGSEITPAPLETGTRHRGDMWLAVGPVVDAGRDRLLIGKDADGDYLGDLELTQDQARELVARWLPEFPDLANGAAARLYARTLVRQALAEKLTLLELCAVIEHEWAERENGVEP